jgi:Icc-related predicted phosphoesterase
MGHRWLVASDIHGDDELWGQLLQEVRSNCSLNAVIICGDLTNVGRASVHYMKNVAAAEDYMERMADKMPVYFIYGNHDIGMGNNWFQHPNIHCIQDRVITIDGHKVYGVNMSPCFDAPELATSWCNMTADREVDANAYQFEPCDILVSHCPPFGACDECPNGNIGSPGLRKWVELHQPKHVFCGHVHESSGQLQLVGNTVVTNFAMTWGIVNV